MNKGIFGKINSIQTLGTVDGPGVRFVVFTQGCNLRCGCCHNPDTWDISEGKEYSPEELAQKAEQYKSYFGAEGGVTLSGGEPLLQAAFAKEFFKECKNRGINTCLDTSGSILNEDIEELLKHTDLVLLDIKYTCDADYKKYAGCSIDSPIRFLDYLNEKNIPVIIRQVIISTLNDNVENIKALRGIIKKYPCVKEAELLPFKKICQVKYDKMGIEFPFAKLPTPSPQKMNELKAVLNSQNF